MAMFLLRSSYRLLVAVCFLLGVNVFTILVLNQTGGLSPGKITAHKGTYRHVQLLHHNFDGFYNRKGQGDFCASGGIIPLLLLL